MRYLGIDYGSKKTGLAISDEGGIFAFPLEVIKKNGQSLLEHIEGVIAENNIEKVVLGESLNLKGKENPVMKEINKFKENLHQKTGLEVIYEPEFYTSVQASRETGKDSNIDAQAAALILQSYLDKINPD